MEENSESKREKWDEILGWFSIKGLQPPLEIALKANFPEYIYNTLFIGEMVNQIP